MNKKLLLKQVTGVALVLLALWVTTGCGVQETSEASAPPTSQSASESESTPEPEPEPLMEPLNQETYIDAFPAKNGYMLVQKDLENGPEVGYLDSQGNYIPAYQLPADQPEAVQISQLIKDGRAFNVSEEGLYPAPDETFTKWGFRNIQTGEFVIEPQFDLVGPFSCGRAVCIKEGSTQIIDPTGSVVTTVAQAFGGVYLEDRLIVSTTGEQVSTSDSKTGEGQTSVMIEVIDTDGAVILKDFASVISADVNEYGFYTTKTAGIWEDPRCPSIYMMGGSLNGNLHGFFDLDGNLLGDIESILPGAYNYSNPLNGFTKITNTDKYIWYDLKTGTSFDLNDKGFLSWGVVGENLFWYSNEGEHFGLMDSQGNPITSPIYTDIKRNAYSALDGTIRAANEEGLYGCIDREGKEVLPCQYEFIEFYANSEDARIRRIGKYTEDGLYGLIRLDGMQLTPALYTSVGYPVDGISYVCTTSEQNEESVSSYSYLKFNLDADPA